MTAPGLRAPGAPTPARCVHCGKQAPARQPICSSCRRTLAHVCYGKARQFKATAKSIMEREVLLPGRDNTVAYGCPVCQEWHNGRSSPLGEITFAEAVLICLKLRRFHAEYLEGLAREWSPRIADRDTWRAAVSPYRARRKEVPGVNDFPAEATT